MGSKKRPQLSFCSAESMNNGWRRFYGELPAVSAMLKTSYHMAQVHMKGGLENLTVGQQDLSDQRMNTNRYVQNIRRDSTSSAGTSYEVFLCPSMFAGRGSKGDVFVADVEELQENSVNAIEALEPQEREFLGALP